VNKPKIQATGLLLGTFIAGALVGGAATAFAELQLGGGDNNRRTYMEMLQEELSLTEHQRALVEEFLASYNDATHMVWLETVPRYDEIRSNVRAEIMAILDETQQETYSAMIARSDSVRAERRRRSNEKK